MLVIQNRCLMRVPTVIEQATHLPVSAFSIWMYAPLNNSLRLRRPIVSFRLGGDFGAHNGLFAVWGSSSPRSNPELGTPRGTSLLQLTQIKAMEEGEGQENFCDRREPARRAEADPFLEPEPGTPLWD